MKEHKNNNGKPSQPEITLKVITFAVVLSLLKKDACSLYKTGDMNSFYHHCNGGVSCEF